MGQTTIRSTKGGTRVTTRAPDRDVTLHGLVGEFRQMTVIARSRTEIDRMSVLRDFAASRVYALPSREPGINPNPQKGGYRALLR
jgi:hypothetical protein